MELGLQGEHLTWFAAGANTRKRSLADGCCFQVLPVMKEKVIDRQPVKFFYSYVIKIGCLKSVCLGLVLKLEYSV